MGKFELVGGVKRALDNAAGKNIFDFSTDKRRALAGFDVLEIYDKEDIAAVLKSNAFSEIARCYKCHKNLLYFTKSIVFYRYD